MTYIDGGPFGTTFEVHHDPFIEVKLVLPELLHKCRRGSLASLCKTGSGQPQCIYLTQGLVNVWYFSVHWFSSFLDTMVITK